MLARSEAKTEFLQIRVSGEDKRRIAKAAAAEYLDESTWARRTLLKELERLDQRRDGK
jgi:hypothetical protein